MKQVKIGKYVICTVEQFFWTLMLFFAVLGIHLILNIPVKIINIGTVLVILILIRYAIKEEK